MKQYFTQLDLIRFIYKETSGTESAEIAGALASNPLLAEEYQELYEGYKLLPKATFSPRPAAIQNILRHSEQTAVNHMH